MTLIPIDLHRITSGFHGVFAMGVACQQGTQDTWFCPTFFFWLAYDPIVMTRFPEIAVSFLDFSPWISLSILLVTTLHAAAGISVDIKRNKEEIWLSPMTKVLIPTEMSNGSGICEEICIKEFITQPSQINNDTWNTRTQETLCNASHCSWEWVLILG